MRFRGRKQVQYRAICEGTFDPNDTKTVKHTKLGVWDLYEDRTKGPDPFSFFSFSGPLTQIINGFPFLLRMLKDLSSIRAIWVPLVAYIVVDIALSAIPAISLWYSGKLLKIVQQAVEDRTVDRQVLLHVALGRCCCTLVSRILENIKKRLTIPLNAEIRQFYSTHYFHALARLDVPTFDDPAIESQIHQAAPPNSRSSIAWDMVVVIMIILTAIINLISQFSVLISVLGDQRDGILLASLCFVRSIFKWYSKPPTVFNKSGAWAATTSNTYYLRSEGMKRMVGDPSHRKEIVAGGMQHYLLKHYRDAIGRLREHARDIYSELLAHKVNQSFNVVTFFQDPLKELPQIVFTLRAVQQPSDIPVSLASLNLITHTTQLFSNELFFFVRGSDSIQHHLVTLQRLYEISDIQNIVVDGWAKLDGNEKSSSKPEDKDEQKKDQNSERQGLEIEFRHVSFKYPGSDCYALKDVSFCLLTGSLCVIVGSNGSGKSTILKLLIRLYDPLSGAILINGRDVREYDLDSLRRVTSVLFQDYTYFPLSIADNIGLGDPMHLHSSTQISEAARLGGAADIIMRLPEGYDTYLERPVKDHFVNMPAGTRNLFGRQVNKTQGWATGGGMNRGLSGGEMQRIALSRTFMRSLGVEDVGLLLFDEPSASLDPTEEHNLFERLRSLRGNKTMIFSSHRFGNLTKHADVILYMSDSVIVEKGTHVQLLALDGEYARIWKLQMQAFL